MILSGVSNLECKDICSLWTTNYTGNKPGFYRQWPIQKRQANQIACTLFGSLTIPSLGLVS